MSHAATVRWPSAILGLLVSLATFAIASTTSAQVELGEPIVHPNVTSDRRPGGPFVAAGVTTLVGEGPERFGGRLEVRIPFFRRGGHSLSFFLPAMIMFRGLEFPEVEPGVNARFEEYTFWLLPGIQYEFVPRPGRITDRVSIVADVGLGPALFVRTLPDSPRVVDESPRDWDFAGRASFGGRYEFPSGFMVTLAPAGLLLTFRDGARAFYEASVTAGFRFR